MFVDSSPPQRKMSIYEVIEVYSVVVRILKQDVTLVYIVVRDDVVARLPQVDTKTTAHCSVTYDNIVIA